MVTAATEIVFHFHNGDPMQIEPFLITVSCQLEYPPKLKSQVVVPVAVGIICKQYLLTPLLPAIIPLLLLLLLLFSLLLLLSWRLLATVCYCCWVSSLLRLLPLPVTSLWQVVYLALLLLQLLLLFNTLLLLLLSIHPLSQLSSLQILLLL